MRLIQALGMGQIPDDVGSGARSALADGAALFLGSGGVLSLDDWRDLGPAERAAFRQAWLLVEAGRACSLAVALSGGADGVARVAATADGGAAADGLTLDRACDAAAAAVAGKDVA